MSFDTFKILEAVKKEFNEEYIRYYVNNNYADYLDEGEEEDFEEEGIYEDIFDFYSQEGLGGNGIEGDLMTQMGQWAAEKFGATEDELWDNEDFRYGLDYYILEHFPTWYFIDYREKTDYDKLMDNFDEL